MTKIRTHKRHDVVSAEDDRIARFLHEAMLPDDVRAELLGGLAGFDACGFHIDAWADRFATVMAAEGTPSPRRFVGPLGVDADALRETAGSAACREAFADLDDRIGDRALLARVDCIELSKNLLRGFDAFDLLLEREPAWRGRVVFGAFCYPSRESVPAYARYRDDIVARVDAVGHRDGFAGGAAKRHAFAREGVFQW